MDFSQLTENFKEAMRSHEITPPDSIIADDKLHRFHIEGDQRGTVNGWYVLFIDRISYGVYGSWKTGVKYTWCSTKLNSMSYLEQAQFQKQISDAKCQREAVRKQERMIAAKVAEQIYFECVPAKPSHPYLVQKRIRPFCAYQFGNNLVLPIMDFEGKLWSLQYISPNGKKWFLNNGSIAGHFIPLHHDDVKRLRILICEGFATAATLADIFPDDGVLIACNAGNLRAVAIDVRQHLPKAKIIICADDDRLTHGNPGLTKGKEAALAANALYASPNWPARSPINLTDFNDLACWLIAAKEEVA